MTTEYQRKSASKMFSLLRREKRPMSTAEIAMATGWTQKEAINFCYYYQKRSRVKLVSKAKMGRHGPPAVYSL